MLSERPLAHTSNGSGEGEPLTLHLDRTSRLCGEFLAPVRQVGTGRLLGLLHDIGKRDELFQQVLRGERQRVNHALAGAALIRASCGRRPTLSRILATVIACHHGGLDASLADVAAKIPAAGVKKDPDNRDVALGDRARLKEALEWLKRSMPGALARPDGLPEADPGGALFDCNLSEMLLTRLLYSGLVDADWSATAEFYEPDYMARHTGRGLDAEAALSRLMALREEKRRAARRGDAGITPLNRLRDALFDRCLEAGDGAPGLYTLTAPTGMGKTLALMAFALRHCQRHGKRRVIVLLPWLTLAEQNTAEYRRMFTGEEDLIEVHSAAWQEAGDAEPEDDRLRDRVHALSERWSAPCVVTTVVSFFEPLFSAQPRACRHLHQIADSVIILDEAQSLPHELLHSTLLTVLELTRRYGCTVLFSTATQPSFARLPGMGERWRPVEIAPDPQRMTDQTRRVAYRWRLGDAAMGREDVQSALLSARQALLIVNTRAVAQSIYGELRKARADGTHLLSADLCQAHRQRVLSDVRERLRDGRPCLLVSTSCIEAGVDVSFPVLLRQLAPLESIIQAAGRCNRNGLAPDGLATVFEFADDRDNRYPGRHYERCAKTVKAMYAENPDMDLYDLGLIDAYHRLIFRDKQDDPRLVESVCALDYEGAQKAYRMIDEYGINLIVPYDAEAFCRLRDMADAEGLTPALIRQARPYAVNIPLKIVADVACPIPVRGRGDAPGTGWYLLGNPDRYDGQDGFGLLRQTGDAQDFLCG